MTTVPKKSNGVSTAISTNGASTASSKRKTSKKKRKEKLLCFKRYHQGSKKIIYGTEKIFVNHISNKGLASENMKNTYSSIILKWAKTETSLW